MSAFLLENASFSISFNIQHEIELEFKGMAMNLLIEIFIT
jgi:hypothetical protein